MGCFEPFMEFSSSSCNLRVHGTFEQFRELQTSSEGWRYFRKVQATSKKFKELPPSSRNFHKVWKTSEELGSFREVWGTFDKLGKLPRSSRNFRELWGISTKFENFQKVWEPEKFGELPKKLKDSCEVRRISEKFGELSRSLGYFWKVCKIFG